MTREQTIGKRICEASPLYRMVMLRAFNGEASPREAIKAQCLICVGYEKSAITRCTGFSCPLHRYRPYQTAGVGDVVQHHILGEVRAPGT